MSARRALAALLALWVAGCSAPALPPDLAGAERAERQGDVDAALAFYDAAVARCERHVGPRRPATCADAYLGRAELLERTGRELDAARAYEGVPARVPDDPVTAATATYRAGRIYLARGQDERGYELLWRAITHYPDQGAAADALRVIVRDGRRRNADQLYQVLASLIQPLAGTGIADNLLHVLAELAERERGDRATALAFHDKIALEHPRSGLRDDALWHGARLARALGDARGAAQRLRALLATREVALGAGSYFSVWLDNAQLELGRVLRDDLGDIAGAARAFERLPVDYPASVLIDDALWELAVTWASAGDRARACAVLARLRAYPDSRYELERAPALRRELGCS